MIRGCAAAPSGGRPGAPGDGHSVQGDVRGAHAVTVGDGGDPLHPGAEEPGEQARLGLAELGVPGRHMGDRAMVLAQLVAPGASLTWAA